VPRVPEVPEIKHIYNFILPSRSGTLSLMVAMDKR